MTAQEERGLRGWARGMDGRAWAALAASTLIVALSLALALYRLGLPYDGYSLWLDGFNMPAGAVALPVAGNATGLLAVEEHYAAEIVAGALTLSPRPPAGWRIGETLTYRFQSGGGSYEGQIWLHRGPGRLSLANPLDLASLAYALLVGFIFARRPRSAPAQLLLVYTALLLAGVASRAVTSGWSELRVADLFDRWAFWPTLLLSGSPLSWAVLLHFVLIFPRPKPWLARAPWLAPLALYGLPLGWTAAAALWCVAAGRPLDFFALSRWPYLLVLGLGAPLALVSLWRSYKGAADAGERAQVRWVGLGVGVVFAWIALLLAAFGLAAVLPADGLISAVYALTPLVALAPPVGIAVAFVRHGLFAEQVAAAAQRLTADLRRSRERLVAAREEERRRLRRDLHDGLGPTLAGLTLKVDAARNTLERDPAAADALLVELRGQIQGAVGEIRRLVYALRPPALDQLGLGGALEDLAEQCALEGLALELALPGELPPLPPAVEVAAYRIAQEAMTNVVRHSGARRCMLGLALSDEALVLTVEDDGRGLPPGARPGVGLTSMAERAEELGGRSTVEPRPEGGTRVRALLPL